MQIDFLARQFGIKPVAVTSKHNSGALLLDYEPKMPPPAKKIGKPPSGFGTEGTYRPMQDDFSIWGKQ